MDQGHDRRVAIVEGPVRGLRAPEVEAAEKTATLPAVALLVVGVIGGVCMGLGANLLTILHTRSGLGFGLQQVLNGLGFSLGPILAVVSSGELFAGNSLLVVSWMSGRVSTRRLVRSWALVFLGNLLGALGLVLLVFVAEQYALSQGAVGVTAAELAAAKCRMPFMVVLARGIVGGALIGLGLWFCQSARTVADKVLGMLLPITAFVAGGFEHCTASMYFVPLGLVIQWSGAVRLQAAPLTLGGFLGGNLLPATLGNVIGSMLTGGALYWITQIMPNIPASGAPPRRSRAERLAKLRAQRPYLTPPAAGREPSPSKIPDEDE